MDNYKENLGLIAAGKRNIADGKEYDQYFNTPDFVDTLLLEGNVNDTVLNLGKYIVKYSGDTKEISQILKGKTRKETCENIFDFVFNHIQYKQDAPGIEQLRRPARTWAERTTGVDCDCYTFFIGTILYNLGIPFCIRITKYDYKPNFQHVYPIVPISGNNCKNGYYTIDAVLNQFNYEKQFTEQKTYTMSELGIPIQLLHGVENSKAEQFIENLINDEESSLHGFADQQNVDEIYNHLVATRDAVAENPAMIATVDDPEAFLKMLDYAIEHWYLGEEVRNEAIRNLALQEARVNEMNGLTYDDLDGINDIDDDDYLEGIDDDDEFEAVDDDEVYEFDALGQLTGRRGRRKRKAARRAKRKARKAERKERKAARKAERKKAKGFFRKIGVALKQGAKVIAQQNPLTIASRNGYLMALKLNLFKISSKLKWGYATRQQAAKHGMSGNEHAKRVNMLKKVQRLFVKKLGGTKTALKSSILHKRGLNGLVDKEYSLQDLQGLGALDPATEALIIAATPVITATLAILGQKGKVDKDTVKKAAAGKDIDTPTPSSSSGGGNNYNPNTQSSFNPNSEIIPTVPDSPKKSNLKKWLIGGGIAVVTIAGVAIRKKKKQKQPALSGAGAGTRKKKQSNKSVAKINLK